MMAAAVELLRLPRIRTDLGQPRELLNIFQADAIGCHIITVTNDILKKLTLVGKDLGEYSLERSRCSTMTQWAGYSLRPAPKA